MLDGRLVTFSYEGVVAVAEATPVGYREKARLAIADHGSYQAPTVAEGRIFVRNFAEIASLRVIDTTAGARLTADGSDRLDLQSWQAVIVALVSGLDPLITRQVSVSFKSSDAPSGRQFEEVEGHVRDWIKNYWVSRSSELLAELEGNRPAYDVYRMMLPAATTTYLLPLSFYLDIPDVDQSSLYSLVKTGRAVLNVSGFGLTGHQPQKEHHENTKIFGFGLRFGIALCSIRSGSDPRRAHCVQQVGRHGCAGHKD